MELAQLGSSLTPFQIPFDAQLGNTSLGNPTGLISYQVMRSTFFAPASPQPVIGRNGNLQYAELEVAKIKSKAGTYERWYVANLCNWQPFDGQQTLQMPDMHHFHMHLVNFVVLRRFSLKDNGDFTGTPVGKYTFDSEVRHDTVRINSNEIVELLVYFPLGYTGEYPYHCHLVEHEDMGMMLHFSVA
ncbi:MAG: multicopper oxidase domain-containing protein [Gallionella sp.]